MSNINIIIQSILIGCSFFLLIICKNYLKGFLLLAIGIVALLYLHGFVAWFLSLGGDSYVEARNFNIDEANFWIQNFFAASSQIRLPKNAASLLIVGKVFLLGVVIFILLVWRPFLIRLFYATFLFSLVILIYYSFLNFEEVKYNASQLGSEFEDSKGVFSSNEDIDLFIYIGESTTSLNLGIYGYPLNTTPKIERLAKENEGILVIENVRSRHTHTSPSLLNALSISFSNPDGQLKLWGIGNILENTSINTSLFSVQPISGSFSQFAHHVFKGIINEQHKKDLFKGDYLHPKYKDHEILEKALLVPGVVFFHSYAGHGNYLDFIDLELSNDVEKLNIEFTGIFGGRFSKLFDSDLIDKVNNYNRAITYIDHNITTVIESIKSRNKPAALIYFSDHGESVYSRGGHDSSRFIDEMSRVPVILYFNHAYQQKYPHIYSKYLRGAKSKNFKLLDQVSPTILDLLVVKSKHQIDVPTLVSSSKHPRPYILDRTTLSGSSRIDLIYDQNFGVSRTKIFGGIPEPTSVSVINDFFSNNNSICYHRSNSFAKAVRGASLTNCLEFDLVVDGNDLNIHHPPKVATGFQIQHIFKIAESKKNNLWIDAKNLDNATACNTLLKFLESNRQNVGKVLVEFPSEASINLDALKFCSQNFERIGVSRSYYVPTHLLLPCAKDSVKNSLECDKLYEVLRKVIDSDIFSDLSFDFSGYSAIVNTKGADKLKWNTWTIKPNEFHYFPSKIFNNIIIDSSFDPNSY
jgi:hypothetical protein